MNFCESLLIILFLVLVISSESCSTDIFYADDCKRKSSRKRVRFFNDTSYIINKIIIAAKSIVDRILLLYRSLDNNVENPWLL